MPEAEEEGEGKKEYRGTVYANADDTGREGGSQPRLGTVRLPKEKGDKISGYATSVRHLRGFAALVRAHFDSTVKEFIANFRTHSEMTVEIFGDIEEVDGDIRVKFDQYSDDELLDGVDVFYDVWQQFHNEVKRRGIEGEQPKAKEREGED